MAVILHHIQSFYEKYLKKRLSTSKATHFLNRSYVAYIHDVFMATISVLISLGLRVGDSIVYYEPFIIFKHMLVYGLLSAGVFLWAGIYRGVWRYTSLTDLTAIGLSVTYVSLLYLPLMLYMGKSASMPRSLVGINWFVSLALIAGSRLSYRLFFDKKQFIRSRFSSKKENHKIINVVVIGVNDQSEAFVRQMKRSQSVRYRVIGFIDNDDRRIGRNLHGIEIFGNLRQLPHVIQELRQKGKNPEMIILADPTLRGKTIQKVIDDSKVKDISLSRLPQSRDMPKELDQEFEIKPISIEDLLGRPQAALNREKMRELILGKRVLITGAGGSIGGELVKQISEFSPSHLCIIDHSEYLLYSIDQALSARHPQLSRSKYLCDVSDRVRVNQIFEDRKPEIVFHAAALKHVPIAEENIDETALTNVIGTRNVAEACRAVQATAMVLISTDKAINPSSLMGATKRLSECYCQALNINEKPHPKKTHFITVRFGNVLASTGSVVPLFQRQIEQGGPLTITHPDMRRYFMTIHEAVELVLQAAAIGHKSDMSDGEIFVLDMGEPVKILDLAHQMIQLAGLRLDQDIKIEFTGLRPGEKLFEELFDPSENPTPSNAEGVLIAKPRSVNYYTLVSRLKDLEKSARNRHTVETLEIIQSLVPEYKTDIAAKAFKFKKSEVSVAA